MPATHDTWTFRKPALLPPILYITADGTLFFKGRKVTVDSDFKAAMLALAACLRGEIPTYPTEH